MSETFGIQHFLEYKRKNPENAPIQLRSGTFMMQLFRIILEATVHNYKLQYSIAKISKWCEIWENIFQRPSTKRKRKFASVTCTLDAISS